MVDARVWRQVKDEARENSCDSQPISRGSEGPQKATSWLSEGVRAVFTIHTEIDENPCTPKLHIFGATPISSWIAGTGGSSLGMSPRNVCRNDWETVVL